MQLNRVVAAVAAATCIFASPAMTLAAEEPDATLDFSGGTIAAGIGYSWGKGVLHYQGQTFPVTLKGLSVATVGAGSVKATGDVYHLSSVADFEGNYTAASAGVAVAGGGSVSAMQNQNGVVIKLRSTTQGLEFKLSVDGVAIALKK